MTINRRVITGRERERMSKAMARDYKAGDNIRQIAVKYDRSYGTVYRQLLEAGVKMRSRRSRPRT